LKTSDIEQCNTEDFLLPFEKMIEYQLEYIKNPNDKNRPSTDNMETTKIRGFKKSHDRNVIFESSK
jgi:hypothetical protein